MILAVLLLSEFSSSRCCKWAIGPYSETTKHLNSLCLLVCKKVLWLAGKDLLLQPCLFAILCPGTSHVNFYSLFYIFIWTTHKTKAVAAFLVICCFLSCMFPTANDIKKQAKPAKPPSDNLNKTIRDWILLNCWIFLQLLCWKPDCMWHSCSSDNCFSNSLGMETVIAKISHLFLTVSSHRQHHLNFHVEYSWSSYRESCCSLADEK